MNDGQKKTDGKGMTEDLTWGYKMPQGQLYIQTSVK